MWIANYFNVLGTPQKKPFQTLEHLTVIRLCVETILQPWARLKLLLNIYRFYWILTFFQWKAYHTGYACTQVPDANGFLYGLVNKIGPYPGLKRGCKTHPQTFSKKPLPVEEILIKPHIYADPESVWPILQKFGLSLAFFHWRKYLIKLSKRGTFCQKGTSSSTLICFVCT